MMKKDTKYNNNNNKNAFFDRNNDIQQNDWNNELKRR